MFETAKPLTIGQLAKRLGKTPRALRLYEEKGLFIPEGRSPGGFRLYGQGAVQRLEWILTLTELGLPLAEIQSLLADVAQGEVGQDAMAPLRTRCEAQLKQVAAKLKALTQLKGMLGDALDYLGRCRECTKTNLTSSCNQCATTRPEGCPTLVAGMIAQPLHSEGTQP